MKLLIIGANGSVGVVVTKTALQSGHQITAYVRNPAKLGDLAGQVHAVAGGLDDLEKLKTAMQGVEAVISCAGVMNNQPGQIAVFDKGMRTIVAAMKSQGLRRIVTINGMASPIEGDKPNIGLKILRFMGGRMMREIVGANMAQWKALAESGLDYTAVRPGMLTQGPATGKIKADAHHFPGMKISRADLARFMVDQVSDKTFIGKAPMVCSG